MNKARHALTVILASCAWLVGLPSYGAACDSGAADNTDDVCYIDITVDTVHYTASVAKSPVTFTKANKVMLVWRVSNPESRYAFQADGLWLPINADTKAFDKPSCQSADKPNWKVCESDPLQGQIYFIWQVKQPYKSTIEYKLKLYPLDKDAKVPTIEVRVQDPSLKTQSDDPIWVDPTIVIQG